jgi:uncharacterized membrane protein
MHKIWFLLGEVHPLLNDFPIVLVSIVFGLDVAQLLTKKNYNPIAKRALLLAVLFFIPALITGLLASKSYAPTNHVMILHLTFAFIAFPITGIHAAFRYYADSKLKYAWKRYFILFSFINIVIIGTTADEGGLLAYGRTIFQNPKVNVDSLVPNPVNK